MPGSDNVAGVEYGAGINYEIRISGVLSDSAREDLGELEVTDVPRSTLLSGWVKDQAALLGLLARVRSLGLDIQEVRRVLGDSAAGSGD